MNHRSNSFDVLRLFAAVLVVYGHAYPLTGQSSPLFAGNSVQAIGVKIFFVISGYLIMGSWERDPSVLRYALRRVLRILPGLVVVVLGCSLIIGPWVSDLSLRDYFSNGRLRAYLLNIALYVQYDLPGVFTRNVYPVAVNGSLWSLPAEVAMYVIGPLAWLVGTTLTGSGKKGVVVGACVLIVLSILFIRIHPLNPPVVVYGSSISSFLDVAPYFLLGSIYALFRLERLLQPLVALVAWFVLSYLHLHSIAYEAALYLVLPYVVLTLGLSSTRVGDWLSEHGDISYGVYLYGFPIQQVAATLLPVQYRFLPWANFAVALPVVLVLATISWRAVEQPFLRLKPRRQESSLPASAVTSLSKST